jgi:type VI secretion system secreted protein Hcp
MTIRFTDVMVISYHVSGSNVNQPKDEISINSTKIEYKYKPEKSDGSLGDSVKMGSDLKKRNEILNAMQ